MKRLLVALSLLLSTQIRSVASAAADPLETAWHNPPPSAGLRAYWWWLNSNVTKQAITRDLEQMKAKGFGGALIFDAGGAEACNNAQVPRRPLFFSPACSARCGCLVVKGFIAHLEDKLARDPPLSPT